MTIKVQITIGEFVLSIEHPREDLQLQEMLTEIIKPLLLAIQYSSETVEKAIPEQEDWK